MKVVRGERELSEKDVEEIPKGLIPGEWVMIADAHAQRKYISYVNPHADIFFKIKILKMVDWSYRPAMDEKESALKTLDELLLSALKKRERFDYHQGCRLVFGASDSLPGLIVDKYKKYILVQINTAGLDRFREHIRDILKRHNPDHSIVLFDNDEYRKSEVLPVYEKEKMQEDLAVVENALTYTVPLKVMQKIGFYYDHRENRARLRSLLERMNIKKTRGLDLFSYVGSWGLHLLSAGVVEVEFVDQGDMQEAIKTNLSLNDFSGRGSFVRSDVFKYLDTAFNAGSRFNVIVSDPPAFTKSEKNKIQALQGYEKLHTKALRLIEDEGLFVAASCTHYASHEELDKTMQDAAHKNGQKLQLLDLGLQGHDHPMTGLKDKSFYIKYLVYFVSRG